MSNQERVIPQSVEAEESVLGAAILSPQAFGTVVAALNGEDFYRPANKQVFNAMFRMWERGDRKIDPVLIGDELKAMGEFENIGGGGYLASLMANTPGTSNVDRYVSIIQERTLMRQVLNAATQIGDMAYETNDVAKLLTDTKLLIGNLDMPLGAVDPSPNLTDFMNVTTSQDWLVRGLIERGDRLMLTAAEGAGKSTLIRQMALQLSSGLHPWVERTIEPIKVLIIDVENSIGQIQRQLRPLMVSAGQNLIPENLRIEVRPEGLDLTNRHDARWLFERVASARPDVVTIGPVYKLHAQDPNDELPAREVAKVLDEIRIRYGCALLIEAHTAKGSGRNRNLRPFGASLWLRWPEFGYGIKPIKGNPGRFKFEEWRGPRDEREWPEYIKRGGKWLWTAEARQERFDV